MSLLDEKGNLEEKEEAGILRKSKQQNWKNKRTGKRRPSQELDDKKDLRKRKIESGQGSRRRKDAKKKIKRQRNGEGKIARARRINGKRKSLTNLISF